jgi:hypothetical protein
MQFFLGKMMFLVPTRGMRRQAFLRKRAQCIAYHFVLFG